MMINKSGLAVVLCGTISACACAATPPLVTPDPTAAPNPTFTGITVQFTSNISGGVPPLTYAWTFKDGGSSTVANPIHAYAVAGNFTVSLLVSDSAGQSQTLSVQVVVAQSVPLAFTSPPTATPVPNVSLCFPGPDDGTPVQLARPVRQPRGRGASQRSAMPQPSAGVGENINFLCAAAGNGALTFAWDFGDGNTDTTAAPAHSYFSAGTFTATVTVTDATNATITGSVNVVVNEPLIGTGLDSNGNGISDDIDDLSGVCPYDPNGSPVADLSAPPTPLNISKMQIKLNFSKKYRNTITINGTLPIPAGIDLGGKVLTVLIGGVIDGLPLNSDGKTNTPNGVPLFIKVKGANGAPIRGPIHGALSQGTLTIAQNAAFTLKLNDAFFGLGESLEGGTYADVLAPYGLTNATTNTKVRIPVTFIFNQILFSKTATLNYTARSGKSGMAN